MKDNIAVFTKYEDRYVLMHICQNKAEHIFAYQGFDDMPLGTIINCTVDNRLDNIDSSFIRFSRDEIGFVNTKLSASSTIPLQYKKEGYKDKKPLFTENIVITGEYVVVTYKSSHIKASSKIPGNIKKILLDRFSALNDDPDLGIVIRTKASEEDGLDRAEDEFIKIRDLIRSVISRSEHVMPYNILYKPVPECIKDSLKLADLGVKEIVTDLPEIFDVLNAEHSCATGAVNLSDRVGLRFYEDRLISLCNLYSFNAKISEALSHIVYLKSGAYLTFDRTEALTAVDVNSSGSDIAKGREESYLAINIEACDEIARQLRIRNISGMIIVDFISMKSEKSYQVLESHIRDAVSDDIVKTRFVDFSGLKLAEIVRERTGRSLYLNLRS